MKIIAIAAVSDNGIIGVNGRLPWSPISEDMKRFRELTTGHIVVMGRYTWNSLPIKPLPNRRNVVLSTTNSYLPSSKRNVAVVFYDLDSAITYSKMYARNAKKYNKNINKNVFIIGGERLYQEALQHCDEVYLTRVHQCIKTTETDTVARFPDSELFDWKFDFEGMTSDKRASFYRYYR